MVQFQVLTTHCIAKWPGWIDNWMRLDDVLAIKYLHVSSYAYMYIILYIYIYILYIYICVFIVMYHIHNLNHLSLVD